jgi:prepilin-type N-terminal cleavage/methylation domain-containing protein
MRKRLLNIAKRRRQAGFTLIETMIAIVVITVGVLGLAAMLASGLTYMNLSQDDYIAQQKAAEAVESVFTARDIGQATWSTICNVGSSVCSNGVFLVGALPLCDPGPDGIIGTADDFNGTTCNVAADAIIVPGTGGAVNANAGGGKRLALSNFTRTIVIANALDTSGNIIANLRQITVTVTYTSGRFKNRAYTLNAYISNFS